MSRSCLSWSSAFISRRCTILHILIGLDSLVIAIFPSDRVCLSVIVDIHYRRAVCSNSGLREGLSREACVGLSGSCSLCTCGSGLSFRLVLGIAIVIDVLPHMAYRISRVGVRRILRGNSQVGGDIVELVVPTGEGIAHARWVRRCRSRIAAINGIGLEQRSVIVMELNEIERIVTPEAVRGVPTGYLVAVVSRVAGQVGRLVPLVVPVARGSGIVQADEDDVRIVVYLCRIGLAVSGLGHHSRPGSSLAVFPDISSELSVVHIPNGREQIDGGLGVFLRLSGIGSVARYGDSTRIVRVAVRPLREMVIVRRRRSQRYRCAIIVGTATRCAIDRQRVLVNGLCERCLIGCVACYSRQRRYPLIERIGILRRIGLGRRCRSRHYAVVERLVRDLLVIIVQIGDGVRAESLRVSGGIDGIRCGCYYLRRPTCERIGVLCRSRLGRSGAIISRHYILLYIYIGFQYRSIVILPCDSICRCYISRRTYLQAEHTDSYLTTGSENITTSC